jgi:hypothetical protein
MKFALLFALLFCPCAVSAAPSLRVPDAALAFGQGGGGDAVDRGFSDAVGAMAVTMAVECYKHDGTCGKYVGLVIAERRWQASDTAGIEFTVREIVETRAQFTGIESSPLLRDPVELTIRTDFFRPIAAAIINGELDGKYPPMTHYARLEVLPKKSWGRAALKRGGIIALPDGHGFVPGNLPFVLPTRAKSANKRLSWSRCIELNGGTMAELFPSCRSKPCKLAAR